MSLAIACAWTLLRSVVVVAAALPICSMLARRLDDPRQLVRRGLWTLLLVPLFVPELFIGYAYANFALSLVHHPALSEVFVSLLLLTRVIAVGTIMLRFAPMPAISSEAVHCGRLLQHGPVSNDRKRKLLRSLRLWGAALRTLPAVALMWLLVFQQFAIVSVMGKPAWTVWLFDAQIGGLPVSESLRYSLLPLACQFVILSGPVYLLVRSRTWDRNPPRLDSQLHPTAGVIVWALLCGSLLVNLLIPSAIVLRGAWQGVTTVIENLRLAREIGASVVVAVLTAAIAYLLAAWLMSRVQSNSGRASGWLLMASLLPGLLGSTVLAVAVLFVFQNTPLSVLYDTPVPLLVGMTLLLLPAAALLRLLLLTSRYEPQVHVAALLVGSTQNPQHQQGRQLLWHMRGRVVMWTIVILALWAYFNVTITALLAPTGMVGAMARLYNLMHYGQSAVLSAMLVFAIVVPVLLVALVLALRRPLVRWGVA